MESCLGRMAKSPMVSVLYVFALLAVVLVHGARASSFCQEVVEPLGYGCTEFAVETNDGFVLEMHRLSRVKSLVQSADRGSAPAVDKSPAYSRAPTNRGQVVSQYPQDHGLSPAVMLTPSDGTNSSINDSSSAAAHYIGSSPGQALKVPRNRSTDAQHSDSVNATHRSKRRHHHSQRSSPGSPEASRSSNRTSGNSSSQQPVVAASLAPTSTQNASSSSTQEQSQRTTDSGTPSNYTANPKAGKGSPVFLMHQEFFNGDTWFAFVDSENRTSSNLLPIMLLNDGFDVWIGHQRATYWSHGHVHLKPTDREYWDWTWDEHVKYDLPAQLLFISTETNQPVHFIGASQAATVGTAATTDHDIAMMIRSLTLIGPTAYRGYTSSLLLEAWAYFFGSAIDSGYYAMGYQNGAFNYST
ncbi:hypothetical protein M758_6G173600 [Ceratodon purpureus]|nr:hypothetical protein M758_6G173600 [Ceratodon purpureus]